MTTVHPALSFELFPPRSHASCESLIRTIAELEGTNPDYVSVTYSGDAKRRQKTLALLDYLVHETSLTPLAHLICAGHSVHELERAVRLILGLGVAAIVAMLLLGRRAQTAAFAQIENQPGRSGAAMNSVRRGWIVEEQPVAANRNQDLVFRALGRPGIVLVTEGPHSRVNSLVNTEKKHLNRVAPGVPVHVIETGHDEGQVELKDVVKTMNKLPKALTQQEMQVVSGRLSTLNTMRNPMNGLPKGVDPMRARPDRRAMRGR